MAIDFNTDPYYDDYSDNKQFYKILFKPGRAVQARELTQLQTILQRQVTRLGNHLFKEGSIVDGAQPKLDDSAFYLKANQTFGGSIVNFQNIEGKYIREAGTGRIALVKKYTPATGADPITIHATIKSGSQFPFLNDTQFDVFENENDARTNTSLFSFSSLASESSGESLLFHISEGVFYAKETFLFNNAQTVIVGKYTKIGSAVIGFDIVESIVEYDDDETLLDPAVGSSNYLAPGADRYKIDLVLTTKTYTAEAQSFENFIEIAKVRNGELLAVNQIPIYDNLAETLARRTFDESGDYIVKNFIPMISPDPSDNSKLTLEISPGKAYVRGYEINKPSSTYISLNKSRSTLLDSEFEINTYYGNYTYINTLYGELPTISSGYQIEIHNVKDPVDSSSRIGTARIKNIEYFSGSEYSIVYVVFLYDLTLTESSFSTAESFVKPNSGNYITPSFKAYIDSQAKTPDLITGAGLSKIFEPTLDTNYFLVPQTYISSLGDVEYTYRQHFYANSIASSTFTLTCRTSDSFATASSSAAFLRNYTIINTTTGNILPVDTVISYANTSTNQVEIVLNTSEYDGDNLEVIATIRTPGDNRRTKKLNRHFIKEVTVSNNITPVSLLKSDVYELEKVYELPQDNVYAGIWTAAVTYETGNVVLYSNASANIANVGYYALQGSNLNKRPDIDTDYWAALSNQKEYYSLDNGQTDNYYDHGTLIRNANVAYPGNALAIFSYFTHDGAADSTGYMSGQSYPIDYSLIPDYVSADGTRYPLRDIIDFRPRRVDDSTEFSLENNRIPEGFSSVVADVTYYQRKIDKVVLTREGKFKVIEGLPAYKNPPVPDEQEDSITLYILTYQPYTDFKTDVKVKAIPYKRYTMKDISSIDNRLSRVEYYTALNLLEEEVSSSTYVDENGITLFKNGFLVDSFKGHGVGDVQNPEYSCSIDYTKGLLRPPYIADNYELIVDPKSNNNFNAYVFNGNIKIASDGVMTVGYTEETFVNQPIASKALSVNPFDVIAFSGTIKLLPQSDTWFDTKTLPTVIENVDGENDNFENFQSIETKYNAWQTNWSGEKVLESVTVVENNRTVTTRETVEVTQGQSRTGTETLKAPPAVVLSTTTKVVDQSVIPYARSKAIQFKVDGMAPFADLYLFINGRDMSGYLVPLEDNGVTANANVTGWSGVTTDSTGSAVGLIYFPNDENAKFPAGTQSIVICDNPIDYQQSVSFAQATYFSQGLLQTKQTNVVSTKGDYLVKRTLNQDRLNQFTTTRTSTSPSILEELTPNATYSLSATQTTYNEGDTITYELACQNVPPGKVYQANLYGSISASDISVDLGPVLLKTTGSQALNKAYLHVPIVDDLVDDDNEFITLDVEIPVESTESRLKGGLVLRSNVVIRQTRNETFSATAPDTVNEGDTFTTTFTAANLYSNLTVNYSVGGTVDSGDFTGNAFSGSFVIAAPGGSHNLEFTSNTDNVYEAVENFKLTYSFRESGRVSTSTRFISNNAKTYVLYTDKPSVTEGESFTVRVAGNNLEADENVAYVVTGISAIDLTSGSLTGNIKIEANGIGFADFTTNNDGVAETTESFILTIDKPYPNDATISIPIYDTGDRSPKADVRVLGTPVFNEGSTIEFECITSDVPVGSKIAYKILGVSGTKVVTLNGSDYKTSYSPLTNEDLSGTLPEYGIVNSQFPQFFTVGANGNAYARITILEDTIKDGVKGGVIQLQDYTTFSNVYTTSGRLKSSQLIKKEAEFIILDTSNVTASYDVNVQGFNSEKISDRSIFAYLFTLANADLTTNVTVNFSFAINPDYADRSSMPELIPVDLTQTYPVKNSGNSPWWVSTELRNLVTPYADSIYKPNISIQNKENYSWYVDYHEDLSLLYLDALDGGQRFSILYTTNNVFTSGTDQYNRWTRNAFGDFRRAAAVSKAEFGRWHYTKYGKQANYYLPVSSEVTGSFTLVGQNTYNYSSVSETVRRQRNFAPYVMLAFAARPANLPSSTTRQYSTNNIYFQLLVNGLKDSNGRTLQQTAKSVFDTRLQFDNENKTYTWGALGQQNRKPAGGFGDFLDSRRTVSEILTSSLFILKQATPGGSWNVTSVGRAEWEANKQRYLSNDYTIPYVFTISYPDGKQAQKLEGTGGQRDRSNDIITPARFGSDSVLSQALIYDTAGLTQQQVSQDPFSKGKILVDLSFTTIDQVRDLGFTLVGYYRSILNRNPSLSGFINMMNKMLGAYRDFEITSPAFSVGTSGDWGTTPILFTPGTGTTGTLTFSGQRNLFCTWPNSTMAYPRYQWFKRSRIMTIPKTDQYFLYIFCDDIGKVIVRDPTTGKELFKLFESGYTPGGQRISDPVYMAQGNYIIDIYWYNHKNGPGGVDFALFPSDQMVSGPSYWRILGGRTDVAFKNRTKNGITYKTFNTDPGDSGTATYVYRLADDSAAISVPISRNFQYSSDDITSSNQTEIFNKLKSELQTKFTEYAKLADEDVTKKASFLACTTDPIAQNFFVSEAAYPDGVFLTGVTLYFKTKDEALPVFVELRPTVNGYPSSEQIVPGTIVTRQHHDVNLSEDATAETRFDFDSPVYFRPGEYSIVVRSNSSKYFAWVSEVGRTEIGTTNIISGQPYVGGFFKSQNASTWTPSDLEDLCFKLHKAVFDSGNVYTEVFSTDILSSDFPKPVREVDYFEYHTYQVVSEELDFDEKTDITYSVLHNFEGTQDSQYVEINPNTNINLATPKTIAGEAQYGNTFVKVTLSTTSEHISPVVDLERLSFTAVQNQINSVSDIVIDETSPDGGNAIARYVTRRVNLAEGFDATGLRVIFDINRPAGSSVKVYYKIRSEEDTTDFDEIEYSEMTVVPKAKTITYDETEFLTDEYRAENVSYANGGAVYNTFRDFSIKIVMFTTNKAAVPTIRNLRAIAVS